MYNLYISEIYEQIFTLGRKHLLIKVVQQQGCHRCAEALEEDKHEVKFQSSNQSLMWSGGCDSNVVALPSDVPSASRHPC